MRSRREPRVDERLVERVRVLFLLVEERLLDELFFLDRVDFLGISRFNWLNNVIHHLMRSGITIVGIPTPGVIIAQMVCLDPLCDPQTP